MNTDEHGLKHHRVTSRIIHVFFEVYNELGPGFLESVYRNALDLALRQDGLLVEQEKRLDVCFRGKVIGVFRADLVVEQSVLLEVKAGRLHPRHEAQALNYLRATSLEVALLLNFGPRPIFQRLLYDNVRKAHVAKHCLVLPRA